MKKLLSILLVIAISILISGCKKQDEQPAAKPKNMPVVITVAATEGNISKALELTGSVTATRVARMGSPAEGPIMQCQVREGDRVVAGQMLLAIGRKKAADALVQAAGDSLAREQEEYKRIVKLVESGAIAAEELETANLNVSRARAELSKAMESVADYQIEAPWDGVISKVFVTDGYYVAPRESLVEIYDPTSTVIEFAVPELRSASITKGVIVEVRLDAYPDQSFKGEITRVYPELNRQTRTRTVEAVIVYNEHISLLPGMFARIGLILEKAENVVLIPDKAVVLNLKNEPTAFVIVDGKAQARKLNLGLENGMMVQIIEGIVPGEMVVIEGNEKLKNGVAVKDIGGDNGKEKNGSGAKK